MRPKCQQRPSSRPLGSCTPGRRVRTAPAGICFPAPVPASAMARPRLLDLVGEAARMRHFSPHTGRASWAGSAGTCSFTMLTLEVRQ